MAKLPVGTKVHCSYRHARKDSTQPWIETTHEGVVIADNDPRIWENTLAFHGLPTQEQVDQHLKWCAANGLTFEEHTAIAWNYGKFQWDSTDEVYPADNCPLCK